MSNTEDLKSRTLTLERTFDAPIKLVWEAWTQPEHIAHWWGPPGVDVQILAHDFTEGGTWKYVMPMPNGSEFISEGVYKEINKPTKIYTTAEFRPMTEGVELEALFVEDGDKTHFTFNVIHPTEAYCKQQEEMGFYKGWGGAFNRLAGFLETVSLEG
ncbi:MAG: SRPBCC domain-containing protein [Bacteroidota bacterium]